jgi:cell division protein FtsB
MRNVRKKQVSQNRKRNKLIFLTCCVLLFIYLTLNMITGENGLLRYIKLKSIKEELLAETLVIQDQNDDMRDQVESREKAPELVEELAREYGMTKEGELVFKFENNQ